MEKRKNIITVHAAENGKIHATIIQPAGKFRANLISSPELNIIEISNHDLHGDLDPEIFMNFQEHFKVDWKRNAGRLLRVNEDKKE